MRFGNFVVAKCNGKIVFGRLGDCGVYLEYMGDANPIPVREVEPLFEIEVSRPFPEYFKVDDFRKFVISTLTSADNIAALRGQGGREVSDVMTLGILEAVREDAERWRALREMDGGEIYALLGDCDGIHPEQADAAIDQVRGKGGKEAS